MALNRLGMLNVLRRSIYSARSQHLRCISTSKKSTSDTATTVESGQSPAAQVGSTTCETAAKKNWISYGFSIENKEEDRTYMHAIMFFGVTVTFVFGGFMLAYRPDELGRDWAQREGYLELRRRESLGLPLVDPNYIPEDQIKLPSDEELGDAEIII